MTRPTVDDVNAAVGLIRALPCPPHRYRHGEVQIIAQALADARGRILAYLRRPCADAAHHPAWCPTCGLRNEEADAIERGDHNKGGAS